MNVRRSVVDAVVRAGGTPVLLPPIASQARAHEAMCDAFVFTGGDDPRTEQFGVPTHPRATVMDQDRQAHETALLGLLRDEAPEKPVLGICLGMQLMALVAGGELNQCLEDDTETHGDHAPARDGSTLTRPLPSVASTLSPGERVRSGDCVHAIVAEHALLASGEVNSWHRQAVRAPGRMRVIARAHDGVIEAIDDPARAFYLGVQWHPERFGDAGLDQAGPLADGLFRAVVDAARG